MNVCDDENRAYDEESRRLKEALRPQLTDEFLVVLVQAARTHGWSGDYHEVAGFVEWCYDIANKPRPSATELNPFQ